MTSRRVPDDYFEALAHRLASREKAEAFREFAEKPLRQSLRRTAGRIDSTAFDGIVAGYGWSTSRVPWCRDGAWIAGQTASRDPGKTAAHHAGIFYLQEAASMLPVEVMAALLTHRPRRVLDLAAAPGSKTTQIVAKFGTDTLVVANEKKSERLKSLVFNLSRCGAESTIVTEEDGRAVGDALPEFFDVCLLDAPCSGEGTVRSDPRALLDRRDDRVRELAHLQRELLESAFRALAPGGLLVYSTCTLGRIENEDAVKSLIDAHPDRLEIVRLDKVFDGAGVAATDEGHLLLLPQYFDSEGFFTAALRKLGPIPSSVEALSAARPIAPHHERLAAMAAERFGVRLDPLRMSDKNGTTFYRPPDTDAVASRLKVNRAGLPIAETRGSDQKFTHEFALTFGGAAVHGFIEIKLLAAARFFSGMIPEIDFGGIADGPVVLRTHGVGVGLVERRSGRTKSALPGTWVRPLSV